MNTLQTIYSRRSIRKFENRPVRREMLERILDAACQAPSGKNRQPWRFVVIEGDKRHEMLQILRNGIAWCKEHNIDTGSSEWTANVMEQAPVTVFVFNAGSADNTPEEDWSIVDIQSIGAAIQTMILSAEEFGLATLWICDVFYGGQPLVEWLGRKDQMVAAVSIGYPAEAPGPRPRRPWQELTSWISD